MDKSFKKFQAGVRSPPSRQCLYFGNWWSDSPSLAVSVCVCLFLYVFCFLFLPLYFGTFYRQRKVLYNLTTKNSLNATILTFWSYGRTQWSRHQNECIPITSMFSRSSCTLSLVSFGEVVCILLSWAEGKISGGMDSRSSSNKAFSFFLCLHVWVARDCWDPSTLPQSLHLKMSVRYSQSSPWY